MAPRDQNLALALATSCIGHDDRRAARLFAQLAAATDLRVAWLGLAASRRRLDDREGAAVALGAALSRHVPDPLMRELSDAVARAAGSPGWCGLQGNGEVVLGSTWQPDQLAFFLDSASVAVHALPDIWAGARRLAVLDPSGNELLGSPIDIGAIRRAAGCVAPTEGGLTGWAWYPGDPDADPVLTIRSASSRRSVTIRADDTTIAIADTGALARPRGFHVPADALVGLAGLLHVEDRDGRDLFGSPLDPNAEHSARVRAATALAQLYPVDEAGPARTSRPYPPPALPVDPVRPRGAVPIVPRLRRAAVVIPVFGGRVQTLACLASVLATVERPARIIVIDDMSPDRDLAAALDKMARDRAIQLIRNRRNLGFTASANIGMQAAGGRDVVLLNSDTLVARGWLEDLQAAAYSARDIGTVTPFSNDASILSYPGEAGSNPLPDLIGTRRLATLSRRTLGTTVVDIPVGVGFCMFIRHDCLAATGLLRADLFAQGYGEENDFCLRARQLGWRHVAAPGVFVAHVGSNSFGEAGRHLRARNAALLERLHPGQAQLVADFAAADPLAPARRRLDLARWRRALRGSRDVTILVTQDGGGGVERQVADSVARVQASGRQAIVLRPRKSASGVRSVTVCYGLTDDFPNLRFALPDEMPALRHLLSAVQPREIEVHHLVGHHPSIIEIITGLGVPYDVRVHDYAWLCGRVALVGSRKRYCGEPDVTHCEYCVADAGNLIEEDIPIIALRERSAALLGGARRVTTPSNDTAERIRRHFATVAPIVVPHEDDTQIPEPGPPVLVDGVCRVCIVGAIGIHKGYDIILACVRDAARRRLPLAFTVVGPTIDDARLMAAGPIFVTGSYAAEEAVELIRDQHATLALLPSIFPETWSFSLTEAWRAGLRTVVFDIGAQAERVRQTGRGWVLPIGLSAAAINNALVAASGLTRHD